MDSADLCVLLVILMLPRYGQEIYREHNMLFVFNLIQNC